MIFNETELKGAYIIELERLEDERGFFARSFCQNEFKNHGLNDQFVQCNVSFNKKAASELSTPPLIATTTDGLAEDEVFTTFLSFYGVSYNPLWLCA